MPANTAVWQAFHKREQTSRPLEHAYDDFCLSTLAQSLGHAEDAAALRKRAMNYKNVADFNPFASRASFITEGSPAQYTFFVTLDVAGFIKQLL